MGAAIYDTDAVGARRQELFGIDPMTSAWIDRERSGTIKHHCGICPKDPDAPCYLLCSVERGKIGDGVEVK